MNCLMSEEPTHLVTEVFSGVAEEKHRSVVFLSSVQHLEIVTDPTGYKWEYLQESRAIWGVTKEQ